MPAFAAVAEPLYEVCDEQVEDADEINPLLLLFVCCCPEVAVKTEEVCTPTLDKLVT